MSHVYRRGPARFGPNLTPMVDVVFLLIIFFVLVAQISGAERFELTLARVAGAATAPSPRERRVVLSVVPKPQVAQAGGDYRVGVQTFDDSADGLAAMAQLLRLARARDPEVQVIVRAARDERSERVQAALRACAIAGVSRAGLVAQPERRSAP